MARDRGGRGGRGQGKSASTRSSPGRPGQGGGPGIVPGVYEVDSGTAEVLPDPFTDGAWLLRINGAESSQLNPGNPLELGFEYMRWMAAVIEARWPEEAARPRILHLGGAGCSMARWATARYPGARQTAVELDARLAALARDHFELPRSPQLRIRVGEAGEVLATAQPESRDLVIRDVFAGDAEPGGRDGTDGAGGKGFHTPEHLIGLEAAEAAARVVGDGIYLVNHGGGPDLTAARREAATLTAVFSTVAAIADPTMLKGRRRGNVVLAATNGTLTAEGGRGGGTGSGPAGGTSGGTGRAGLVRALLSDPLPARLVEPAREFAAGARPFDLTLSVPRMDPPTG